jgi:hypothetical protein
MDANTPATQAFSKEDPIQNKPGHDSPAQDQPESDGPVTNSPETESPLASSPATESYQDRLSLPAADRPRVAVRPTGLNASAVVLGVVALVVAGLVFANENMNVQIDWSGKWPAVIVGIGALFVVLGAIGLVRRHDDA